MSSTSYGLFTFNDKEYEYEYNTCYAGYAVRVKLPNDHYITKYIKYSGHLHISINDEKIPVENMQSINPELDEKFEYEINYAQGPLKYWLPDYSYGPFSRHGKIVENITTKLGWFLNIREYDKEKIESSISSVLQTLEDIEEK
jgi:hypothetical protein